MCWCLCSHVMSCHNVLVLVLTRHVMSCSGACNRRIHGAVIAAVQEKCCIDWVRACRSFSNSNAQQQQPFKGIGPGYPGNVTPVADATAQAKGDASNTLDTGCIAIVCSCAPEHRSDALAAALRKSAAAIGTVMPAQAYYGLPSGTSKATGVTCYLGGRVIAQFDGAQQLDAGVQGLIRLLKEAATDADQSH